MRAGQRVVHRPQAIEWEKANPALRCPFCNFFFIPPDLEAERRAQREEIDRAVREAEERGKKERDQLEAQQTLRRQREELEAERKKGLRTEAPPPASVAVVAPPPPPPVTDSVPEKPAHRALLGTAAGRGYRGGQRGVRRYTVWYAAAAKRAVKVSSREGRGEASFEPEVDLELIAYELR